MLVCGSRCLRLDRKAGPERGRVAVEDVLELGDQKLLMLLLVMDPDGDQLLDGVELSLWNRRKELVDELIDPATELEHLFGGRASQKTPTVALHSFAKGLVVGVEREVELGRHGVFGATSYSGLEQVLGEEPRRVPEIPPGRTDVGHRLHSKILRLEGRAELERESSSSLIGVEQCLPAVRAGAAPGGQSR